MFNKRYKFSKHSVELFLLTLFWIIITMELHPINIFCGLGLAFLTSYVTYLVFGDIFYMPLKIEDLFHIVIHYFFLIFEIYKSAFVLCYHIFTKKNVTVLFPLKLNTSSSLILITVANSITLTPGTITVTASHDRLEVVSYCDDLKEGALHAETIKNDFEKHLLK